MKDILIDALYTALIDICGANDIIDCQDVALAEIYEERIAAYVDDETLLDDLTEILGKATRAAFAKGIEAITVINNK